MKGDSKECDHIIFGNDTTCLNTGTNTATGGASMFLLEKGQLADTTSSHSTMITLNGIRNLQQSYMFMCLERRPAGATISLTETLPTNAIACTIFSQITHGMKLQFMKQPFYAFKFLRF